MGVKAAAWMEKVVRAADLDDAKKKVPDLIWGANYMYRDDWAFTRDVDRPPQACILGVAELASCNEPANLENAGGVSDLAASRLGSYGSTLKLIRQKCPFYTLSSFKCREELTVAEDAIIHINDNHAKSLEDAKKKILRWAEIERKDTERGG